MLLLLLACDTPETPPTSCDALVAPPVVACFGTGVPYDGYGTLAAEVSGTVTTVGVGNLPDACVAELGNGQDVDDAVVVEILGDDGGTYTAAWGVPGVTEAPVAVGAVVSLDLSYTFGEFGPDVGHVMLDGGRLAVAEAGALDDLVVPEGVVVTEGEARCTEEDDCGTWSKYDVDVAVGGEQVGVRYGEAGEVGGVQIAHGGYERQAQGQGGLCPDWFVAHVTLGVVGSAR